MFQHYANKLLIQLGILDKKEAFQVREEIMDGDIWKQLRENKIKSIKEILETQYYNINQEIIHYSGQTLLHQSVVIDRYEIFLLCLLYKANVNQLTAEGMAPIHLAASLGRDKMIQALINNGADVNLKDGIGMTALDRAKLYQFESTQEIIEKNMSIQ